MQTTLFNVDSTAVLKVVDSALSTRELVAKVINPTLSLVSANFSTKFMREKGGKEYFEKLMAAFAKHMDEHVAVYGPDNHLRLTGLHETQSIDKFTYGLSDRGASVRMPVNFIKNGYKGYLEDRRPNSAADPYLVAGRIIKTIKSVPAR